MASKTKSTAVEVAVAKTFSNSSKNTPYHQAEKTTDELNEYVKKSLNRISILSSEMSFKEFVEIMDKLMISTRQLTDLSMNISDKYMGWPHINQEGSVINE